jgi:hypothetical protein
MSMVFARFEEFKIEILFQQHIITGNAGEHNIHQPDQS